MTKPPKTAAEIAAEAMESNFVLLYAKDVTLARGTPDNTEWAHFKTRLGVLLFIARNKTARVAIRAGRFEFIKKIPNRRWYQFWRTK